MFDVDLLDFREFAVVFGGIGTLVVVIVAAFGNPQLRRYGRLDGRDVPVDDQPPNDSLSATQAEPATNGAPTSSPAQSAR